MTARPVNHPITITTHPGSGDILTAIHTAAKQIAATVAPLSTDPQRAARAVANASHYTLTTTPVTITLTYPAPLGTGPLRTTLDTHPYGLDLTYYCPDCENPLRPDLWTEGLLPHDHVERDGQDLLVFSHHLPPDTIMEQPTRVGPPTEDEHRINEYLNTELDPTTFAGLTWTVAITYTRHTHDPHTGKWRYRQEWP